MDTKREEKVLTGTDLETAMDIADIVNIDKDNISDEFITQAGKYAWYSTLLAHGRRRKDEAKLSLEVKEAELDAIIRKEANKQGIKITEVAIQKTMYALPEYKEAVDMLIKMKEEEGIIEAVVNALEQRATMLVSYGSLLKHELASNITILEEKSKSKV